MLRQTLIQLSQRRQLQSLVVRNDVARKMARRFVAGETLEEAISVVGSLNAQRMTVTLDHLGENVTSRHEAIRAAESACEALQAIAQANVACNVSIKLTQLGLDVDGALAEVNLGRLLDVAEQTRNFVRIDMEGSAYVEETLRLFSHLYLQHRNVGVVIQSYLFRSEADVERLIESKVRVRLVKGAYLESASVAYQHKNEVDANYVRLMKLLLARGAYPAIATHDQTMIDATVNFAREQGIGVDRFEFQMLYGIRRDLQSALRQQGYNVRIYVPYGTEWYPYLMRRLAERPANVIFVLGNIVREAKAGR